MKSIYFEKANVTHMDTIFAWLAEPKVQEFWDNTQAHKDDILNFIDGRVTPSAYADGKYVYWIAFDHEHPFAMLMTIQETPEDQIDDVKLMHLSKTGHTYGIEYMIGDQKYFGKGYGAKTLRAFVNFFRSKCDPLADTFLIDPASDNPRAKHVYMKAGFLHVADFVMSGEVSGAGKEHHLLIKRFLPQLLPQNASLRHVALAVNKLDECEQFYNLLGMKTELKTQDYVYLRGNGDNISLHKINEPFEGTQRLEHIGFALDSTLSVDQLYQDALKQNLNILSPPKSFGIGTHSFSVLDPDGIEVEFTYHPPMWS